MYSVYNKTASLFLLIRANVTFVYYKDGELSLSKQIQYNIGETHSNYVYLTRHLEFDARVSI